RPPGDAVPSSNHEQTPRTAAIVRGVACEVECFGFPQAAARFERRRMSAGGICIASRYLLTVRRATWMPRCESIRVRRWSDRGLCSSSPLISWRIIALTAVAEQRSPRAVPTPEVKNRLKSITPDGVIMYLFAVTRDT